MRVSGGSSSVSLKSVLENTRPDEACVKGLFSVDWESRAPLGCCAMDAIELIYRLRRAGYTQASLARELGITRATVNGVVHGRQSARVATHIAGLVGVDIDVLWPGRYRKGSSEQSHHTDQQPEQNKNLRQK